jgi:Skp family chaperone for outer membrane proteins
MNKLLLATAAAVLAATPFAAIAQRATPALIVIVDTETIFRTCTACVAAQGQLQGMITALQQQQQTLSAPIQAEASSIEAAAAAARNLTGAARTSAEAAIQTRLGALQTRQNQANQTLQRQEQTIRSSQANVSQQLSARLDPIVRQVMSARGANIVLPKGATLAASDALDVTSEVLAALNQQLPSVTVAPLPQAANPAQPQQPRPQGR